MRKTGKTSQINKLFKDRAEIVLCLEVDEIQEHFGTHNDMKSHTGSIFTLGMEQYGMILPNRR